MNSKKEPTYFSKILIMNNLNKNILSEITITASG